ncbi:MAG TPA: futalosine hydrolase [Puia sp.]|nr:futalosine hydrolase [Puia sp.]
MHILLASATAGEIQPAIDVLEGTRSHRISRLTTGVGALPTAWALMRQIDSDPPDLIIQAGIAGSLKGEPSGKVFAVRAESFADLGVWEDGRFKTVFDLRLANPDQSPFTGGRLVNPYPRLLDLTGLDAVDGITVNEISTAPERIHWLQQNTSAVLEGMEGGALHYIGLQEGIPFLQLRSVSNAIGVRDKSRWNIPLAVAGLNERLIRLVKELDGQGSIVLHESNRTV